MDSPTNILANPPARTVPQDSCTCWAWSSLLQISAGHNPILTFRLHLKVTPFLGPSPDTGWRCQCLSPDTSSFCLILPPTMYSCSVVCSVCSLRSAESWTPKLFTSQPPEPGNMLGYMAEKIKGVHQLNLSWIIRWAPVIIRTLKGRRGR